MALQEGEREARQQRSPRETPKDPTVAKCLGHYSGPFSYGRDIPVSGMFLWARYPCIRPEAGLLGGARHDKREAR